MISVKSIVSLRASPDSSSSDCATENPVKGVRSKHHWMTMPNGKFRHEHAFQFFRRLLGTDGGRNSLERQPAAFAAPIRALDAAFANLRCALSRLRRNFLESGIGTQGDGRLG